MARLVDADKLLVDIIPVLQELVENPYIQGRIIGCVSNQPTAYDVDKVVGELEDAKNDCGFIRATVEASSYCKALNKAKDIVRKGGVE